MERFFQTVGGVLVAVVLGITLTKQGKEIALILTAVISCMVLTVMMNYLEPILDFVRNLQLLGNIDMKVLGVMLKAVGVGMVGELAVLICADAGNSALGKALQIFTSVVILWISLPLMQALIDLIESILGEL